MGYGCVHLIGTLQNNIELRYLASGIPIIYLIVLAQDTWVDNWGETAQLRKRCRPFCGSLLWPRPGVNRVLGDIG